MRSPTEIAFRLRQEGVNLARFLLPVSSPLRTPLQPNSLLADPLAAADLVRGTGTGDEIVRLAGEILKHRFPVFGQIVATGPQIDWHCDYNSGRTSGLAYFRRIPYLDFASVGDHKWTWELNRHQHLVVLAQAFLLTGRSSFLTEIEAQITSWSTQNPFVRGINWASALEVAFRALSWIWVDHLVGGRLQPSTRLLLQNGLWLHAKHLSANLSTYFSPNTHLLGEGVALYAIGTLYAQMPNAEGFAKLGSRIVEEQLDFQMHADGSHFEQSTYYQVYAVDFFAFYYVLAGRPGHMVARLRKMAEYLNTIMGPARRLFCLGDDDGGRLFFPYGERDSFGRATLATASLLLSDADLGFDPRDALIQAAWWLKNIDPSGQPGQTPGSCGFPDSGLVSLVDGAVQVLFDAGPFGWRGAGHSHADTLEVLVRQGDAPILDDAGTFVYTADVDQRNWFRGTAAHNTVVIDGRDQASPTMPFRWLNKPIVCLNSAGASHADAHCEYGGFDHRRIVLLCGEK